MAELTVTHRYAASPERVFDAWIDPAKARRFLFTTPDGEVIRCEIDARPGGRFTIVDRRPESENGGGEILHVGEYRVVDRPRRLVFTFAVPQFDPTETVVDLTFEPDGDGCRVTLHHTGVIESWAKQTVEGWTMILANAEGAV